MTDAYLEELGRELRAAGVGGADSRRLLDEAREHLRDSTAHLGESGAVEAFGPARLLAAVVAAELATARTRRAAYAAFAALAPVGLVYAILFLTFPSVDTVQGSGLPALSLAGAVFFPQLAFVCGVLAVLRVVRRGGETRVPAADLSVVRQRTAFALAGGALTLVSLGAFALDQRSAISTWWFAGALVPAGVVAPGGSLPGTDEAAGADGGLGGEGCGGKQQHQKHAYTFTATPRRWWGEVLRTALHVVGKLSGFLRRRHPPALASRKGCFGSIDGDQDLQSPPLAFPQRKCFLHSIFFALEPSALNGVADQRFLIGAKLHFHTFLSLGGRCLSIAAPLRDGRAVTECATAIATWY